MIEVLSLPRRHNLNVVQIKNIVFKTGLPINSLPGWENIPLNSKLPMLKCPGNQVIFSKNKIGQSFKHLKQEFDPFGYDNFPEYNPLHDSNLKTFYANERNLKRLRENGEITQTNDVICTLKDFNEYRLQLHKSQLYYVMQELNRLESEQRDRILIFNAEAITTRDHRNISARQHSQGEILYRRDQLDHIRALHYTELLQKTNDNFKRIATFDEMKSRVLHHNKILHNMKMQRHWEICHEDDRKRLIHLKKLFQFKKERLRKNMKQLEEKRTMLQNVSTITSWKMRLNERIANQKKIKLLLEGLAEKRRGFIENHRLKYAGKWAKIQEQIQTRANNLKKPKEKPKKKKKKKKKKIVANVNESSFDNYRKVFDNLVSKDLLNALKVAVEMHSEKPPPFDLDDPIYKAATFILENIIKTFDRDLSGDRVALKYITENVKKFFEETKSFVLFRATQIISHLREMAKRNADNELNSTDMVAQRNVSFSTFSPIIGMSSYAIHPSINLKHLAERSPTPAGSLASIPIEAQQESYEKTYGHLSRNDIIFVEHFVIKFKHELIVGVGRRVFRAIQSHFDEKIMDVRKELLEFDKKFLSEQMASAILSYAINSLNFDSCIKLCVAALASDIIWSLQKHLLRPKRDPRGIVLPHQCCLADVHNIKLCLFCEVNEATHAKCKEENLEQKK